MNFTDIFYTGPEHIVAGYQGNYKLSPGKVTVESWMADILIIRGYGLALKPAKGVESYERRNKKQSRKVSAGHKESIQERGELKCSP
ncbi:hypothetical protein [Ferroplasma sp.]|jgi:hypothetical protein|uniref:hypothetical protein n=1 Tax=Ferroplasma sp. TaxID=2591003 RepID=UPI002609AFB2|nr:hypothetical protein [Ferroplasma sp.]